MAQVKTHHGHPVIYEKEPITLIKIPVSGERLDQCVLLHPRYAPSKRKYEKINVRGFRRGRTLDILLDEPIVIDGKDYGVLNFKGVGADADEQMVIRQDGLWYRRGVWKDEMDEFGRYWGALLKEDGIDEFSDDLLPSLGIPFVPHVAVNNVPRDVCKLIAEKKGVSSYRLLSQLVRATSTNIRIDTCLYDRLYCFEKDIDSAKLACEDFKVIQAQRKLKKLKKTLCIRGDIAENRFIDGTFIDAENYLIKNASKKSKRWYDREIVVFGTVYSSLRLLTKGQQDDYLEVLEQKTGRQLKDLEENPQGRYFDPVWYLAQQIPKQCLKPKYYKKKKIMGAQGFRT